MKAKLITYGRFFENAKIEIQFEVEENENESDVFEAAKQFVEKRCSVEKRNHTLAKIEKAETVLSVNYDDLPF